MAPTISLQSIATEPAVEIMQADGGSITIGRGPDNHIVVDSEAVSRVHGGLTATDGHWIYQDFESTNGSWINGVKLAAGQSRLVRHGDVLQLADFPMRVVEVHHVEIAREKLVPTLLVFYSGDFEGEVSLDSPGARFAIGGPDGQFFVEGFEEAEDPQLEITHNGWRLELTAGHAVPVIVNGMAVRGVTALNDRDEVGVASYRIIVNDVRSAASHDGKARSAPKGGRAVQAYERPNAPEHLRKTGDRATDWESEAARRRSLSGKKFVFGSEPEEDVTSTIGVPSSHKYGGGQSNAFEMSVSQRFSAAIAQADKRRPHPVLELVITLFGVFLFLGVLGLCVYLFLAVM